MSRLGETLAAARTRGRTLLMAYLCAGDPTLAQSVEAMQAASDAGADIIEIGWPFSDPVADGPVIQAASGRALGHTGRAEVLEAIRQVRRASAAPIAVLGYCNPVLRHGLDETAAALAAAGADALLAADLSFEESEPWRAACRRHGLSLVPFIAPTTRGERLRQIAGAADSFVYAVARLGVTGQRAEQSQAILPVVEGLREHTDAPVLAGFGIGDASAAVQWRQRGLDGVIVGSALVAALAGGGVPAVREKVREIRSGLDNLG